jgi:RNA polymerase sigma-70 factor (ECF subfamily)
MSKSLQPPTRAAAISSDDDQLGAALRSGDELAFADLVERLHHSLVRLARLYVADNAAEDVAQETWLALLRGLDRFEGRASLKTWLFRVLVNRARSRAVRDARTIPFGDLADQEIGAVDTAVDPDRFRPSTDERWPGHWLLPPLAAQPEQQLLADELHAHVRAAVAQLTPAQREVVTLRDIDGFAADEVCQLLDLSDANQRVLLHRGRSKVRAALEGYIATRSTST